MNRRPPMPRPTRGLLLAVASALSACATAPVPVVYQTTSPSPAQVQRVAKDIERCRQQAQDAVGLNARTGTQLAQSGARAGAIGFAAAAAGAWAHASRDAWQRARSGAAAGAVGVAARTVLEWNEPDKVFQAHVERCLDRRGHDVLGWR